MLSFDDYFWIIVIMIDLNNFISIDDPIILDV